MELRHLKLIDTVAREGSLSKASDKLHLTQSALSHQLKEIEQEMGVLMFHRVNKRLEISEAGKIIRRAALNVQQELTKALQEIDKLQHGSQGEIRLSTECYTCYHWLPKTLDSIHQSYKHLDVHILPEFTKRHFEGLRDMDLDLVITSLLSDYPEIAYEELVHDEQLLIVSKEHPYSTRDFVTPEDFKSETLLIYSRPVEESTFYRHVLLPAGIQPNKILEVRLTEAAVQLVKNNYGVKVMAKWAAEPYILNHDVVGIKIGPSGMFRKWYLAYNKNAGWQQHYDVFKSHLAQHLNGQLMETT